MKLYSPGCMENKKEKNGAVFPYVDGNLPEMVLYYPACMEINKQMKLYSARCMENKKQVKLYSTVCIWKITDKCSCIPLYAW